MRVPQAIGNKGSLKWIQELLTDPTQTLESAMREILRLASHVVIEWKSPLVSDDYSEYRDAAFLEVLGLDRLKKDLRAFWPRLGPQWDALAVTSDGKVILVEAKAHAHELASSCTAEGDVSRATIVRSLESTKQRFGARPDADWTNGYYQYANRLAHVDFLRAHGVDAHLVFVYLVNDRGVGGPSSKEEWAPVLDDCHMRLGLPEDREAIGVHSVFIDVSRAPEFLVAR